MSTYDLDQDAEPTVEDLLEGRAKVPSVRSPAPSNGLPIAGPITSRPGDPRPGGRKHAGTDIAAPGGTPVPWNNDTEGVVKYAGPRGGYGNLVVVDDGNQEHWYAHLQGFDVKPGDRVGRGSTIGRVGNSGFVMGKNGGYHLHYETRPSGSSPFGQSASSRSSQPTIEDLLEGKATVSAPPVSSGVGSAAAPSAGPASPLPPAATPLSETGEEAPEGAEPGSVEDNLDGEQQDDGAADEPYIEDLLNGSAPPPAPSVSATPQAATQPPAGEKDRRRGRKAKQREFKRQMNTQPIVDAAAGLAYLAGPIVNAAAGVGQALGLGGDEGHVGILRPEARALNPSTLQPTPEGFEPRKARPMDVRTGVPLGPEDEGKSDEELRLEAGRAELARRIQAAQSRGATDEANALGGTLKFMDVQLEQARNRREIAADRLRGSDRTAGPVTREQLEHAIGDVRTQQDEGYGDILPDLLRHIGAAIPAGGVNPALPVPLPVLSATGEFYDPFAGRALGDVGRLNRRANRDVEDRYGYDPWAGDHGLAGRIARVVMNPAVAPLAQTLDDSGLRDHLPSAVGSLADIVAPDNPLEAGSSFVAGLTGVANHDPNADARFLALSPAARAEALRRREDHDLIPSIAGGLAPYLLTGGLGPAAPAGAAAIGMSRAEAGFYGNPAGTPGSYNPEASGTQNAAALEGAMGGEGLTSAGQIGLAEGLGAIANVGSRALAPGVRAFVGRGAQALGGVGTQLAGDITSNYERFGWDTDRWSLSGKRAYFIGGLMGAALDSGTPAERIYLQDATGRVGEIGLFGGVREVSPADVPHDAPVVDFRDVAPSRLSFDAVFSAEGGERPGLRSDLYPTINHELYGAPFTLRPDEHTRRGPSELPDLRRVVDDPDGYREELLTQARAAEALRRVGTGEHVDQDPAVTQRMVADAERAAQQFPELADLEPAALAPRAAALRRQAAGIDEALLSPEVARRHADALERRAADVETGARQPRAAADEAGTTADALDADVKDAELKLGEWRAYRESIERKVGQITDQVKARVTRGEKIPLDEARLANTAAAELLSARKTESQAAAELAARQQAANEGRGRAGELDKAAKAAEGAATSTAAGLRSRGVEIQTRAAKALEGRLGMERKALADPASRQRIETEVRSELGRVAREAGMPEDGLDAAARVVVNVADRLSNVPGVDREAPLAQRIAAVTEAITGEKGLHALFRPGVAGEGALRGDSSAAFDPASGGIFLSRHASALDVVHELVHAVRLRKLLDPAEDAALTDWARAYYRANRDTVLERNPSLADPNFSAAQRERLGIEEVVASGLESYLRDGRLPDGSRAAVGALSDLAKIGREIYSPVFASHMVDSASLPADVRSIFGRLVGADLVAAAERPASTTSPGEAATAERASGVESTPTAVGEGVTAPTGEPASADGDTAAGEASPSDLDPRRFYNARTMGLSGVSDEASAKLDQVVSAAVTERGLESKTIRTNAELKAQAERVLGEDAGAVLDLANWRPGDPHPPDEVIAAARDLARSFASESASLETQLERGTAEDGTPLTEGQKLDVQRRIEQLDRDAVGIMGAVLPIGTAKGRALQALSVVARDVVNPEQILRKARREREQLGLSTQSTKWKKQEARFLKRATKEGESRRAVADLADALRESGVDPKHLHKPNGEVMEPNEAVRVARRVRAQRAPDAPAEPTTPAEPPRVPAIGRTRQAWAAGTDVRGTVEFVDATHRDLFNLGAELRYRTRGGKSRTSDRSNKNIAELTRPLVERLGLTETEVRNLATDVHRDVREQMKGLEDGEVRRVVDRVGAAQPAEETASGAPVAPSPVRPFAVGHTAPATTERGTTVETRYAVVNARDLVTSHNSALRENPAYPAELQPRDRSRAASAEQVARIASDLRPEFLGESPKASDGAPIVGPDNVVESGNGRTIALRSLFEQGHGNGEKYKAWLVENAARFGLDPEAVKGAEQPVLVRVRQTDVDRPQFAREANESSVAAMSATEQARADAKHLDDDLLSTFVPNDDGNLGSAANAPFRRAFFDRAMSQAERGRYVRADGTISQEGLTRIRNAVFARAYGDTRAVEMLAESPDPNVRNVLTAMTNAAPRFAAMRGAIESGALHDLDIAGDVADAVSKLSALRESGQRVDEYIRQLGLFGEDMDPVAKDLLVAFDANKLSARRMTSILLNYAHGVEALGDPHQAALFGGEPTPTRAELLDAAISEATGKGQDDGATLFGDESANGGETPGSHPATEGDGGQTSVRPADSAEVRTDGAAPRLRSADPGAGVGEGELDSPLAHPRRADLDDLVRRYVEAGKHNAEDRKALVDAYRRLSRQSWGDTLSMLRKVGFLWGFGPTARNLASNAANLGADPVLRGLAPLFDAVHVRLAKAERGEARLGLVQSMRAGYDGAVEGVDGFIDAYKSNMKGEDLRKLEVLRESNSGLPILDAYINFGFRNMSAGDALFRGLASRGSLMKQAKAQALNEAAAKGLEGSQRREFVKARTDDLYANPTPEMQAQAAGDAETATFNGHNKTAELNSMVDRWIRSLGWAEVPVRTAKDLSILYAKVPASLALRTFDLSGGGIIRAAIEGGKPFERAMWLLTRGVKGSERFERMAETHEALDRALSEAMTPQQRRDVYRTLSRGIMGPSLLMTLGAYLARLGYLTPSYDRDEAQRDKQLGRQPNSLVVGGKSYSISWLGPVGAVMAIGANLVDAQQDHMANETFRGRLYKSVRGAGQVLLDHPMLSGISNLAELVRDATDEDAPSGAGERALQEAFKSYIPFLNAKAVGETAAALDDREREIPREPDVTAEDFFRNIGRRTAQTIQKDVPLLRNRLPESVGILGDPLQHNRFDLVTKQKDATYLTDPIGRELVRLDATLKPPAQEPDETGAAYHARAQATGEQRRAALVNLFASKKYQQLANDDDRRDAVAAAVSQAASTIKTARELLPSREQKYDTGDPVVRFAIDFDLSTPTVKKRTSEDADTFKKRGERTKELWREAVRVYAPEYAGETEHLSDRERKQQRSKLSAMINKYVKAGIAEEFPAPEPEDDDE